MALTEEEILALSIGPEADVHISGAAGYRIPNPTTNLITCYQFEDKVAEDGEQRNYVDALQNIVESEGDTVFMKRWKLLHATPLQRSQAFMFIYGLKEE